MSRYARGQIILMDKVINEKRRAILDQLSEESKEKAKYIFGVLNEVFRENYAFLYSLCAGVLCGTIMVLLKSGESIGGDLFLLIISFSSLQAVIVFGGLKYFYYDPKSDRILKELNEQMNGDTELRKIFWKIRKEGHPCDFRLATKVWQKISKFD
jgi:hypothetical protein